MAGLPGGDLGLVLRLQRRHLRLLCVGEQGVDLRAQRGFGLHMGARTAFLGGIIFTIISLVRSYVLRRYFNGLRFGNATTR